MLLCQRLTSALNHRGHYGAGLAMSALSAGGLENETSAANLLHGSPSILESPAVTYPRKSPSNITTPATGLKDQRWQSSQGISFGPARVASGNGISRVGDRQSQDFFTIARQPASLPTKPPSARPPQPCFRPYSTTQYKPVNLFMSEVDEDDTLSCEDASKAPSRAETQKVQDSQPVFEPKSIRKDPGRPKPPLTLKTPSPKSQVKSSPSKQITHEQPPIDTSMSEHKLAKPKPQGITGIKPSLALMTPSRRKPQVESSPTKQIIGQQPPVSEHKNAEPLSQVSTIDSSTNPASPYTSKIVSSLPGGPNKVNMATGLPSSAPHNIPNPYPLDWAAYKKEEPLISEDYLLSAEISRLAQLPAPRYMDVVTPAVEGRMTLDTMLGILNNFRAHGQWIFACIERIIDGLVGDTRNTKPGSSYTPIFNRLELLEMHDELLDRWIAIMCCVHDTRKIMRTRQEVEMSLDSGLEGMHARETSLFALKIHQATNAIDNVLRSKRDLKYAWRTLERFYFRRQIVGLLGRATTREERKINPTILFKRSRYSRLMDYFMANFLEGIAYKEIIQEQYITGPCVQKAILVVSSLQRLGTLLRRYKIARADCDQAGGSRLERLIITPAFHQSFKRLQDEIWEFTRYRMSMTAYEKKVRCSLHDQGGGDSMTPRSPVAKVSEEVNKSTVPQPIIVTFRAAGSRSDEASGAHAADKSPGKTDAIVSSKSATKRTPRTTVADKFPRKSRGRRSNVSSSMTIQELPKIRKYNAALPSGASAVRAVRTNRSTARARIGSLGEKTTEDQKAGTKITRRHYSNEACRLPQDDAATSPMLHDFGRTPQMSTSLPSQYGDAKDDIHVQQTSEDVSQATQVETISPVEGQSQPATKSHSSKGLKGFSMKRNKDERFSNQDSSLQPVYWSYDLYAGPNNEKVKVHYCKNKVDTERVAQMFKDEDVIGFDIEWRANAQAKDGVKKNVSLIQIASEERVALFHVARFWEHESLDSLVAPTFKAIMESPHITKVGVAIKGDCTRLRRFMGIESQGLFELSHLYKLVKYSNGDAGCINKVLVSLATQVKEHLGLPLWKGDARTSDWSLDLDLKQVQYAASDSYAGFQLFHTLEHKRNQLNPTPPRPYHAELNLPIRLTSGVSIDTDDEPEDLEDDQMTAQPREPPSIEELARDFLKIKLKTPTLPATTPPKRAPRPTAQPCRPEVIAANEWVANWRNTLSPAYKTTAAPACLRAHALWHEQGFTVPEAAALLRDPPLLNATVARYVLDALRVENLPFERHRLPALILHVPQAMRSRYKRFIEKTGIDDM